MSYPSLFKILLATLMFLKFLRLPSSFWNFPPCPQSFENFLFCLTFLSLPLSFSLLLSSCLVLCVCTVSWFSSPNGFSVFWSSCSPSFSVWFIYFLVFFFFTSYIEWRTIVFIHISACFLSMVSRPACRWLWATSLHRLVAVTQPSLSIWRSGETLKNGSVWRESNEKEK